MKKKFVKGLQDVTAAETKISYIDGLKGRLVYRGYSIEDLAKNSTYEEVVYLLWEGSLPSRKALSKFKRDLHKNMEIPAGVKRLISTLPKNFPNISALRTCISLLAAFDKSAEDMSAEANKRKALRIMGVMPAVIAAIYRAKSDKKIINPKKGLNIAANFLFMLKGKIPTKEEERVMDVCLILHAEHGLNASTFASRVTVATLSDIYSGIVSAIGTLKGPLHGGANVRAVNSFFNVAKKLHVKEICVDGCLDKVDDYVRDLLKHHIKIMGIGHRVYKVKDPRAIILEDYAKKVSKKYIKYLQIAEEIGRFMEKEKHLYPNVDFFSGLVYENLDIKPELYVCIFALSRTAGWIAHMLEQYEDNRLIRPRSIYVGVLNRKYRKR